MRTTEAAPRIRLVHIITLLMLISISIISIIQIAASFKAERDSLYETTLELNYESAKKMSVTMNSLFKAMENSLKVTSEHLGRSEQIQDSIQAQLDLVTGSSNYFNSLLVSDANGNVLAVSPVSVGLTSKKLTSKAVLDAIEQRKPAISAPYESITNRLIVLMTTPIFNSADQYLGSLGGTIYLRENNVLNDIFGSNSYSSSGSYIYVVDGAGNLIYHPDHNRLGKNVSANPVVAKLISGQSGKEKVVNTLGVPMLAGYSYVPANGWGIVVQSPLEEINEKSMGLIQNAILYSFPFLLLILLITAWLAKKLTLPLARLAATANKILNGKQVADLPKVRTNTYEAYHLYKTMIITIDALQKKANQYELEAQTDNLTGLANRRSMETQMLDWLEEGLDFSLIVLDIDHFKVINDTHGHLVGDTVLKYLGKLLLAMASENEYYYRFGGEEFVVLLPHVTRDDAYLYAEKIRNKLEMTISPIGQPITVSLGVSSFPTDGMTALEVLEHADQALYFAKGKGRNCTVVYDPKYT
ncbi:sensor domain-containing diguanylate cyclase [Paenibacillus alginolyticus]|uniref:Sensor domain-containing diguanylate cyclase n=1 Tax=Paenibacillus alginolyticus TaxID=59839 RepID=A0ABT4G6L7_9BACL|nr:sensor domain-containing diguanylate cyclase [Paenibacillus alginolyticus]MCY9691820.1 sensor domain-containing diguanylate cyclase [Paenibacillus alginolyticus]MEC0143216.1 sensor domain-containing diguanylate cyclase [Paenibacillus alginolyticus]